MPPRACEEKSDDVGWRPGGGWRSTGGPNLKVASTSSRPRREIRFSIVGPGQSKKQQLSDNCHARIKM